MGSARNQFILLGILCQSLTWDGYLLPFVYLSLWFMAAAASRKGWSFPEWFDPIALTLGCIAGYALGKLPGQTSHFFIGHGITWLQLTRMPRRLNDREKMFSMVAACVHIGVGCTVVLDFRFIFILAGALFLIPKTLQEIHLERLRHTQAQTHSGLGWKGYATLFLIMVSVFLGFPRAAIGSPLQTRRTPDTNEGNLVDSVLDPTRSGLAQSGKTILQIEGRDLGLLRSFALVDFDGTRWTPDSRASLRGIRMIATNELQQADRRRVRVKQVAFLGGVLPSEGPVSHLSGKFFRRPLQSFHNTIECEAMWNTANNLYEYWVDTRPRVDRIPPGLWTRMTNHPPMSPKLSNWLELRLAGTRTPLEEARALESYLRDNFTYELGSPVLKRINHLEQFLMEERRGHCERYASSLALLLRMRGIPTRVVIGYLPSNRSMFSGWINIRFKDAHAWTEAFIPDRGWVQLDATPRSRQPSTGVELRDLVDALDLAWFMNVVSFDGGSQRELFTRMAQGAERFGAWVSTQQGPLIGTLVSVALVIGLGLLRPKLRGWHRKTSPPTAEIRVAHYYGQMLRALHQRGIDRKGSETPDEFQEAIRRRDLDLAHHTGLITQSFCLTRYGGRQLNVQDEERVQASLKVLSKPPDPKAASTARKA